jgi:hypothetical protein
MIGSVAAGLTFGIVSGIGALVYSPVGFGGWSTAQTELFLLVGVPIGIGVFFFFRLVIPWGIRKGILSVARIAVDNGMLRIEQTGGPALSQPINRIWVSKKEVHGDWYSVSFNRGHATFFVPRPVATIIATAQKV